MQIGKININPAVNPAILDTAMWDAEEAAGIVLAVGASQWEAMRAALAQGTPMPLAGGVRPCVGSTAEVGGHTYFLAELADSQQVFVEIGPEGGEDLLGQPVTAVPLGCERLALYPTDAATIARYVRLIRPDKAPRAWGCIPRLGIGVRMSAAMWPGIYEAMDRCEFAANSIQNSVRELELLENILAARPPEAIYLPGFGTVESGHTGSTFEGLWVYGVLAALKSEGHFRPGTESGLRYGADADHIKVSHGPEGLRHAQRVLDSARLYTFFTLDVSGTLDYSALRSGSVSAGESYLAIRIPSGRERAAVLAFHQERQRIAGLSYGLDSAAVGRLVGKYWEALDAAEALTAHIRQLKGGEIFDLELAIDERTPEIPTCECITTDEEVLFVLLEARRRSLQLTHLAPNFGVEKPMDYRCPDGLAGLEARVRSQYRIAEHFGVMLDFHSGDDLSSATRQVIARATQGRNHFKISPEPQIMFAETARDMEPALFRRWWDASLAYAQREAAGGSEFAAACLKAIEAKEAAHSPRDVIFHNFGFAFAGKRDAAGQYLYRELLYGLPQAFYDEFRRRLVGYLCLLAEELFRR